MYMQDTLLQKCDQRTVLGIVEWCLALHRMDESSHLPLPRTAGGPLTLSLLDPYLPKQLEVTVIYLSRQRRGVVPPYLVVQSVNVGPCPDQYLAHLQVAFFGRPM